MSWAELGGEEELGQVTVGVAAAVLNGSVHSAVVSECFSVSDTRRSVACRLAVQKTQQRLRCNDLAAQLCTRGMNVQVPSQPPDDRRSRHLRVVRDGFLLMTGQVLAWTPVGSTDIDDRGHDTQLASLPCRLRLNNERLIGSTAGGVRFERVPVRVCRYGDVCPLKSGRDTDE